MQLSTFIVLLSIGSSSAFITGHIFPFHPCKKVGKSSYGALSSSLNDRGWDNDNFLEALSGGQSALEHANDEYEKHSKARAMMRERQFQSMDILLDDEDGVPPHKIQEQQKEPAHSNSLTAESMPPTEKSVQVETAPSVSNAMNPAQMQEYQIQLQVWQAQMNAYVQVCQANPQAAAHIQPPPMPVMGAITTTPIQTETTSLNSTPESPAPASMESSNPSVTIAPKGVDPTQLNPSDYLPRSKNNKDAYEISNPADVYFAQLKRDSTVRSIARRNGDLETANSPFADVGVQALNGILSPELIKKRREQLAQNGGEFETSRDEMILPFRDTEEAVDKSYTGVSYKQKLAQRMAERDQRRTSE
jgi:hypothetical protein